MADQNETPLLPGTLDLLILKALSLQPLHGLGVSRRIEQITKGAYRISPGSLFPALHRLEQRGVVAGAAARAYGTGLDVTPATIVGSGRWVRFPLPTWPAVLLPQQ